MFTYPTSSVIPLTSGLTLLFSVLGELEKNYIILVPKNDPGT